MKICSDRYHRTTILQSWDVKLDIRSQNIWEKMKDVISF